MENWGGGGRVEGSVVLCMAWSGAGGWDIQCQLCFSSSLHQAGAAQGHCAAHSWHTCDCSVPQCEAASGGACGSTEGRDAGAVAWERERFCDSSPGRKRSCPCLFPEPSKIWWDQGEGICCHTGSGETAALVTSSISAFFLPHIQQSCRALHWLCCW